MRFNEAWRAFHVAGLVFELVIEPGRAVIASLDDDFLAIGGHHHKEAVMVKGAERGHPGEQRPQRAWPGGTNAQEEGELHQRDENGDASQRKDDLNGPTTAKAAGKRAF